MTERNIAGQHWPNQRPWDIEQCLRAAPGAITVLHHQCYEAETFPGLQQWGDVENAYIIPKLRWGYPPQGIPAAPDRLIHLRAFYPQDVAQRQGPPDPVAWGTYIATRLRLWRNAAGAPGVPGEVDLLADPFIIVSLANEPLLEWGWGWTTHAYERMAEWHLRAFDAFDAAAPDRRAMLGWSALAQGHDPLVYRGGQWVASDVPDGEYQLPLMREAVTRCDVLMTHPYGHLNEWPDGRDTVGAERWWGLLRSWRPAGWRDSREPDRPHDPGGALAQFPGMPHFVSETGTFTHSMDHMTEANMAAYVVLYDQAAADGVTLGVTPFVWSTDGAHATNNLHSNPKLRGWLEDLAKSGRTMAVVSVPEAKPNKPPEEPGGGETPVDAMTDRVIRELRDRIGEGRVIDARGSMRDTFPTLDQRARARFITLHHTTGSRDYSLTQAAHDHIDVNGWPGVGYHFFVRRGVCYVVGNVNTMRAHVWGRNDEAGPGVAVTGRYDPGHLQPQAEDMEVVQELCAILYKELGSDVTVVGHGDIALPGHGTACPGSWAAFATTLTSWLQGGGAPSKTAEDAIREDSLSTQLIEPNPEAALQRVAYGRGLTIISNEADVVHDGRTYRYQTAANLKTGEEWVIYAVVGDWSNVHMAPRRA